MNKINYFFAIIFIFTFLSCEKKNTNPSGSEEEEPTAQFVEFNLTYNGTAITEFGRTHPFQFTILHGGFEYLTFTKDLSPGSLWYGFKFQPSQKLEPGFYELRGFWDWNESTTQNSNEQTISGSFEVKGLEVETFNFEVIDNTNPSDWGWFSGNVKYLGSSAGAHYLRIRVEDFNGHIVSDDECQFALVYLYGGATEEYISAHMPAGTYKVITLYWDVNDNGLLEFSDPHNLLFDHYICPGLGTLQDEAVLIDTSY